jgi:hypothetical protein
MHRSIYKYMIYARQERQGNALLRGKAVNPGNAAIDAGGAIDLMQSAVLILRGVCLR